MVNTPEYIPINKSYEMSIFARISEVNTKLVNFYLLVDQKVEINKALLCNEEGKSELNYSETDFRDFLGKAYKIDLGLTSNSKLFDSFFEVCIGFKTRGLSETEIAFGLEVEFKNGDKEYFSSYDQRNNGYPLPTVQVAFYKPQPLAGNALLLRGLSHLSFRFKDEAPVNNLMLEFWGKVNSTNNMFFSLTDEYNRDTVISLSSNKYQIISPNYNEDLEVVERVFISKNTWNHYVIYFDTDNKLVEVYSNDLLMFKIPFERYTNKNNLKFVFTNKERNNGFHVDLLRVWEFNNSLDVSLRNKNYLNYEADSSKILLNISFDDENTLNRLNSLSDFTFAQKNIQLTLSDAPIFTQAPEINVFIHGSFYAIEWSNRETKIADEFVLEKSSNGYDFTAVHNEFSTDDLDKIYYYSDPINTNNEIVVYRLKQINKDGTIVYSPQVKIGQGKKEFFSVGQNFPNPFNPTTSISVEIFESSEFEISVFDIVGKKLAKLHEGPLNQGIHSFNFDGSNLPSGIYFFEVKSPTSVIVKKMILAK